MKLIPKYSNEPRIFPYFWLKLTLAMVVEWENIPTAGVNMKDV